MRAQEFTEASKDYWERLTAADQIGDIVSKYKTWSQISDEDFKAIRDLVKITGRAEIVRGGPDYKRYGKAGSVLDRIAQARLEARARSGTLPKFTGRASTASDMSKQLALYTNGYYRWKNPTVWTTGYGIRYKDPADYVEYNSKEDYESAMDWFKTNGKQVHYRDETKNLQTAIQIGRYLIEPATTTRGPFSKNPETTYQVSVRTTGALGNLRVKQDITDQQAAALKDIARTRNDNSMNAIRMMLSVLQGEQDLKAVIDNSKKITPADKAKLDAIIAGAKDFKELPGY